uniref:Uncharacterized protein n=1 Tax=Trypanosoma brucei TaxID=5691 RepID=Q581H2_9TRYP|nr:hypothetical protein, unlikely [Trypanosoma brucei]
MKMKRQDNTDDVSVEKVSAYRTHNYNAASEVAFVVYLLSRHVTSVPC